MTKQELQDWLKSATFVCVSFQEYDYNSNNNTREIWQKDGKYYELGKCNREYNEAWGDKGYLRGVYKPKEVKKEVRTRTITETVWLAV